MRNDITALYSFHGRRKILVTLEIQPPFIPAAALGEIVSNQTFGFNDLLV
jgi:hypothetical protein